MKTPLEDGPLLAFLDLAIRYAPVGKLSLWK